MMRERHVVVGADGSPVSTRALDVAADEAAHRGCALRVVYAVSDRDEAAPILNYAAERVAARHPGVPVETEAPECGVVRALVRAGESAALVVVGHRDLGRIAGLVLGSVGPRLAASTRAPLLVVRGDHTADGGGDVLLGLRDTTGGRAALQAFREAEHRGVRLRVLRSVSHWYDVPCDPLPARPEAGLEPDGSVRPSSVTTAPAPTGIALARELHPSVEVDARTVRTALTRALPRATGEAAVVVIGTRRHTGPVPRPDRLVRALLRHSRCPVLVVPET
jgi:nucleotide-binding universal stress UspA family protein